MFLIIYGTDYLISMSMKNKKIVDEKNGKKKNEMKKHEKKNGKKKNEMKKNEKKNAKKEQ